MKGRSANTGRWTTRDDAGNPTVIDLGRWNESEATRDPLTAPVLRRARKMLRLGWFASAILLAILGVAFWWSLRFYNPTGTVGVIHLFGVVCGISVLGGLADYLAAIRRIPHAVQLMKTWRLCPSCAYALDGVIPSVEGTTTCPECGAKWRCDGPKP